MISVEDGNGAPVEPVKKHFLGMQVSRHWTKDCPFNLFNWTPREVSVGKFKATVSAPTTWGDNAVTVMAQKYMRPGETSVWDVVKRVAYTATDWGFEQGYFRTEGACLAFRDELAFMMLDQRWAPNSPVFFNLGVPRRKQAVSACYIQSVDDTMESILQLGVNEGLLFRDGSGSGTNFSSLRSSKEKLSNGGTSSGPVSFEKGLDAKAGVIKSGGSTRRAAKIAILDVGHPDVLEFIRCKALEEDKAAALIAAGYNKHFDDPHGAYASVAFQNANHSVRVTDDFMTAVEEDGMWELRAVKTGEILEIRPARGIFQEICEAAWRCGDPGLQFHDATNRMHTSPAAGEIRGCNPCQPAWATVLTPEGISTFEDIEVGSTVWSGQRWTKVVRKIATGVKPVFSYRTRAGVFVGTEKHRVISGGERVEAKDADTIDIVQGEARKPVLREPQAILDGLVLGDGTRKVTNGGAWKRVLLTIGREDGDYFEDSDLEGLIRRDPTDVKGPGIGYHETQTTLQYHEVPKTYDREIPERYFYGSHSKVCGFLRGLYSANGSIVDKRVTLKAASFRVIEQVQQMLSALGIPSYYTTNRATDVEFENGVYTCKESYDLNITRGRYVFRYLIGFVHKDKQRRLDEACAPLKQEGKSKTSFEVVDVEALGEEQVFDIEVDAPEHTYWTGGLLVSNCSEFVYLDDSACNLASINLLKFLDPDDNFDTADFQHAVCLSILAQEIFVSKAEYPTPKIRENSVNYRPLGLGYANLGALLMSLGLAYDSQDGRDLAAAITSLMTGEAYAQSARIARDCGGPFAGFVENRTSMMDVVAKHQISAEGLRHNAWIADRARAAWMEAQGAGYEFGFRNAQVTLLAPTGTIGILMGCDTLGIEPDFALEKTKQMVGGGTMSIVNGAVPRALRKLGYPKLAHEMKTEDILRTVKDEHRPVFDCANPEYGRPGISWRGHVDMMAAVQPFLSSAISKCVSGDTRIITDRGLRRIGDLHADDAPDSFRDVDLSVPKVGGKTPAKSFYYGGVKPVWKITLGDGRTITGTAQHRLRTAHEQGLAWTRLPDLAEGSFVALHLGADMWGEDVLPDVSIAPTYGGQQKTFHQPAQAGYDLGQFLGMLTADGHVTSSNYVVGITKNCEQVLARFDFLMAKLFGLTAHRITDARNGVTGSTIGSKALCEWLRAIGFSKESVPDLIFSGSRQAALGYLSGMYLDGWISEIGDVAISQKHRSLLLDMQAFWDNLGVHTYFSVNIVDGRDYPVLHISGAHRRTATDMLEWLEPHKQERAKDTTNGREGPFPLHREALLAVIRAQGRTQEFRTCFDARTAQLTRTTFLQAADALGLSVTEEERTFRYVPVVSVEAGESTEVFDLSVPETEAFVGNGIVNHNTVNMPSTATPQDFAEAYTYAWKQGLKAIAIYRDGCKGSQPLSATAPKNDMAAHVAAVKAASATKPEPLEDGKPRPPLLTEDQRAELHKLLSSSPVSFSPPPPVPFRRRMPRDRASLTHKFNIAGHEGYLNVGLYEDGTPGEIFIRLSKTGSTIAGFADAWAVAFSLALQSGVSLEKLCEKFSGMHFEPAGFTGHPEIRSAASIVDYVARWLKGKYLAAAPAQEAAASARPASGPPCTQCGSIMVRSGSCFCCPQCGTTSGCS